MKTNLLFFSISLFLLTTLLFACGGGEGGSSAKSLSVEDVKKIIDVEMEGFDKTLDEQGLYGGPSAMFIRQSDKQKMFVATNANPEETAFTDDLATAKMSFDSANGEVTQTQVNGKNVYIQATNEQYKAVLYQGLYRFTFGADGKDAAEIKKNVDSLVEKVTSNLKK